MKKIGIYKMNFENNINQFLNGLGKNGGRNQIERYASFDYCHNHFQSFKEEGKIEKIANSENMEMSCLHLGFYLASWGMLRGSSFLLEKSIKYYEPLIYNITKFDKKIWEIDVDNYKEDNINLLIECKEMIHSSLKKEKLTDTLATKIMLGVFANVPAYDAYFRKGFKVHSFGHKTLRMIADFYEENKNIINKLKIMTLDFSSGKETSRRYTKAKIIDMICFIEGQKKIHNV
ncbi:MAG: hypothetical protein MH321_11455 [Leptospiraceae bacterium]|nr:hypothetical protein [Leptospiraceae bacterium]